VMARAGSGRPRAKVTGTGEVERGEWRIEGTLELHKTCMAKMTMTSTK